MLCTTAFVLSLLPVLYAQTDSNSLLLSFVTEAFEQAQIVPDVLPSFAPIALIDASFTASTTEQQLNVTPSAILTIADTAMEPVYSIVSDSTQAANQTYVLALIDPDAPTTEDRSLSQFLHFLGGDFVVDTTSTDSMRLTNRSAAIRDYIPPSPPAGSALHRYTLVVYAQPGDFSDNVPLFVNASTPRNNFDLATFAALTNLGEPVAGNFFLVGPDDSTNSTTTSSAPTSTSQAGGPGASASASASSSSADAGSSAGATD